MNERFVAFEGTSLYPDIKGEIIMRGASNSAESVLKDDQDLDSRSGEKKAKKIAEERIGGRGNAERRERAEFLRQSEKEAGRAAEKEKEKVEELSRETKRIASEKVEETIEATPAQVPTEENHVIVESYPHLENSDRGRVLLTLKSQKVQIDIPENWDKMNSAERKRWYEKHGIVNVTKLPEVAGGGTEWPLDDDEAQGVTGNKNVDVQNVFKRLDILRENEKILGQPINRLDGDRVELQDRLIGRLGDRRNINIRRSDRNRYYNELVSPQGIKSHLEELQVIERNLGTTSFNEAELDSDRELLYERLRLINDSDGRINELLERLLNYEGRVLDEHQLIEQQTDRGYLDHIISYINNRGIDNQNFRFVYFAAKAIEDFERLQSAAGDLALVNNFLTPADRNSVINVRNAIRIHFRNIEQNDYINAGRREALDLLYEPVQSEAVSYRDAISHGVLASVREIEDRLFERGPKSSVILASKNEPRNHRGLVEWHAVELIGDMDEQQRGANLMGTPLNWEQSLGNVMNNLRFIESGDFSQEDLGAARGRIVAIAEALGQKINTNTNLVERAQQEERLREINEYKDAVLAIYDLRIAMETTAMSPEKLLPHFESLVWKDNTFHVFFRRFAIDHLGREFRDVNGTFNLLDRGVQTIFARIRSERQTMNLVEGLSIVDIAEPLGASDYRKIEMLRGGVDSGGRLLKPLSAAERNQLELLRQDIATRVANFRGTNDASVINETWSNPFAAKDIVVDWYRESTLLGAHGYRAGGREAHYLDDRKTDMTNELINLLSANGVNRAMINEYRDSGLLNQVINNSHTMATVLGAFSDYDGIRLWNRDQVWFQSETRGNVPKLGAFAYNNASSIYNGRMVDHYGEFLIDEVRGRPRDADYEFQKFMLGKNRSILGHNRMMTKIIADIIDDTRNFNKDIKDDLVLQGRRSFREVLTSKQKSLEGIEKLDVGNRIYSDGDWRIDGGDAYDNGWSRGAAIEELVQDGEISLENLEFSRLFENERTNIKQFNMTDWWGDRNDTQKFFASGAMQQYLKTPNTKFFFKMNTEAFYSKREIRLQPWMKLVIPAHKELGKHWQEWWSLPYDMPHAEIERVIDEAVKENMVNYKYEKNLKSEYLGWGPFSGTDFLGLVKNLRYWMEKADVNLRESAKRDWTVFFFWPLEFFKVGFQQSMAQLAGR